jgi:uncharacterized protein (DUF697 family)
VINRLFAALILLPPLIWVAALAFVVLLGQVFGCEINEASAQSCIVLGFELAGIAYSAGMLAAWGPLILFPFTIAALLVFAVVALIRAALRKVRTTKRPSQSGLTKTNCPPEADLDLTK